MRRFSRIFIPVFIAVIFLGAIFVAMAKVEVSRENSEDIRGVVTSVKTGGMKDIVFTLNGIRGIYYINRGEESGLSTEDLSEKLLNKEVTVSYARPRILSLISPVTGTYHITELKMGKELIYSEL